MIKISTKTRYALRSLLEIACRRDKTIFNLGELSRHQDISRKYLEHIFGTLKKHGIIASRVGKNGGFYLPADLKNITILKILETLEGEIDIVDCHNSWRKCERINFCPAKAIWQELNAAIKKILESKNLHDLSTEKEIQKKCSYVFSKYKKTPHRHQHNPANRRH